MKRSKITILLCTLLLLDCKFEVADKEEKYNLITTDSRIHTTIDLSTQLEILIKGKIPTLHIEGDITNKTLYYSLINPTPVKIETDHLPYIGSTTTILPQIQSRHASDLEEYPIEKPLPRTAINQGNFYANNTLTDFTLYASNDICNVYIETNDSFIRDKDYIASILLNKFTTIYQPMRNMFGEEIDYLYISNRGNTTALPPKINILVHDINNDRHNGNTIGLFRSIDYYTNGLVFSNLTITTSNQSKCLYIDSYFTSADIDMAISTLVHEFQHLINYRHKKMDSNLNEMMSMLAENLMFNLLDIREQAHPNMRLKRFYDTYYITGIRQWDNTVQSYSNSYALGYFMLNNYGGETLVREIMKPHNSLMDAINKTNNTNLIFDDLFIEFVKDNTTKVKVLDNNSLYELPPCYGLQIKKYELSSNTIEFHTKNNKIPEELIIYIQVF